MSNQFVGYHIDDYREDGVPVATGATKAECFGLAAQRVLSLGITFGEIGVQKNDKLTAEQFKDLTKLLDDWFKSKGSPS